jgi:3-oxoacyl-(acyl-carrier-protein) synthase
MAAALADAGRTAREVGLVHLSANGVVAVDEAERHALAALFGDHEPRFERVKEQIGENPAIGAIQLALAALELFEQPQLDAVLLNAFGAGGNFFSVVLTAA